MQPISISRPRRGFPNLLAAAASPIAAAFGALRVKALASDSNDPWKRPAEMTDDMERRFIAMEGRRF